MAKTTSGVLLGAAKILEEKGWCRGQYRSGDGHYCVLGALKKAKGVKGDQYVLPEVQALMGELGYHTSYPNSMLIDWNDGQKSKWPVIRVLRAAAAGLQKRQSDV